MGMRLLCDYVIPCLFCEEPLEHVTITRDDETGTEDSVRVRLPHLCSPMKSAMKESSRGRT